MAEGRPQIKENERQNVILNPNGASWQTKQHPPKKQQKESVDMAGA
jgi:hypothetical protein